MHVSLVKAGRVFLNVTALLSVFLSSGNVYSQTATGPVSSTQMASGVSLTIQEQEFLRNNPVITVAIDRSVPPIEFRDENGDNIGRSLPGRKSSAMNDSQEHCSIGSHIACM